jgi:3-dehydroquinate dehydratase / shikimate dehydrogenase
MGVFGNGVDRVCGVVATPTARQFRGLVRLALRYTPTVELRLDWLANDRERRKALQWLKRTPFERAQFVATCRRRVGGGEFAGSAGEEIFWLQQAREAGCGWCDLEIETLQELADKSVKGYRLPPKVLLSIHDFRRTPALPKKVKIAAHDGPDAVKIAAMSQRLSDSIRLLRLARGTGKVVAVPMGEMGLPARILALQAGSALLYAPVGAATAPGQVGLRDLLELYRAHRLTQKTRVFGVIGNPIGHSLSPLMHNTGYVAAKKDAVFLPFLVDDLREFLRVVHELGLQGFSVTLPHKQKILNYLEECDPLAEEIGAVNTVTIRRNGKLAGANTDYVGVLRALESKLRIKDSRILIFGAGGAARAAAFALAKTGAEVFVCSRRDKAARGLARAVKGEAVHRAVLQRTRFDAILNATPVGMYPRESKSPLEASELNCGLVMDLIYRPLQTKLLKTAAGRGIRTVSGVEMFLAQGIAQWELWMGSRAPEAAMRSTILKALRTGEKGRP